MSAYICFLLVSEFLACLCALVAGPKCDGQSQIQSSRFLLSAVDWCKMVPAGCTACLVQDPRSNPRDDMLIIFCAPVINSRLDDGCSADAIPLQRSKL